MCIPCIKESVINFYSVTCTLFSFSKEKMIVQRWSPKEWGWRLQYKEEDEVQEVRRKNKSRNFQDCETSNILTKHVKTFQSASKPYKLHQISKKFIFCEYHHQMEPAWGKYIGCTKSVEAFKTIRADSTPPLDKCKNENWVLPRNHKDRQKSWVDLF